MNTITIDKDIKMFYVTSDSYPMGIQGAHDKLHALVPFSTGRKYIGISRPENGTIVYRAGTEEMFPGESEKYGCETLMIKKGDYIATEVSDFRKNPLSIKNAFDELLKQANLDPEGYCVEFYANDKESVNCMIRLAK